MQIKSLNQMEQIVSKNRVLSWEGWTVISSFPSDKARTSKNGALVNGVWSLQGRYEPNETGWDIPDKFVR